MLVTISKHIWSVLELTFSSRMVVEVTSILAPKVHLSSFTIEKFGQCKWSSGSGP